MISCDEITFTIPIRPKFLYLQSPLCERSLFARVLKVYLTMATPLDLIHDFACLFLDLQCVKKMVIHEVF